MDLPQNRLLLVFSPSASGECYAEQERLFAGEEAGFEDRDLPLMRLPKDGNGEAAGEPVTAQAAGSARRECGVGDGQFTFALAGKDGGVKFRADKLVSASEIFDRIDAMPMRRREMHERGGESG